MRPRAKYAVIHRHRQEHPVSVMCNFFGVSRSGYYSFVNRLNRPEKDVELADIIRRQQKKCFGTYGYRRMWLYLKSTGINRNPKTILHVMKKYELLSEIRRRRKWVNLGQQMYKYENLLNRQFQADKPNSKWVTDISYIHTKEGVLYLSMIRDLYDRQQHRGLQNSVSSDYQFSAGHDPACNESRENEGRCRVAAPQRPRLSVYFTGVL